MFLKNAAKPLLGLGEYPHGKSLENYFTSEGLARINLSTDEVSTILRKAGAELEQIHKNRGEGFGYISIREAIFTKMFSGEYDTWYDFLINKFDEQMYNLGRVLTEENETSKFHAWLTIEQREMMLDLFSKRLLVRELFVRRAELFNVRPQLLHGNPHLGSIYLDYSTGNFSGLGDFSQMLVGDPVYDLAYFSVMPNGAAMLPNLLKGWENWRERPEPDLDEKLNVYRLWISYWKIATRYLKHKYLNLYPQPLTIANDEIRALAT